MLHDLCPVTWTVVTLSAVFGIQPTVSEMVLDSECVKKQLRKGLEEAVFYYSQESGGSGGRMGKLNKYKWNAIGYLVLICR